MSVYKRLNNIRANADDIFLMYQINAKIGDHTCLSHDTSLPRPFKQGGNRKEFQQIAGAFESIATTSF